MRQTTIENSPLLQRIQDALNQHKTEWCTLRVRVAQSSSGTDHD